MNKASLFCFNNCFIQVEDDDEEKENDLAEAETVSTEPNRYE